MPTEWLGKCFRSHVKLVHAQLLRQRDTTDHFAGKVGTQLADLVEKARTERYLSGGGSATDLRALFGDIRKLRLAALAGGCGIPDLKIVGSNPAGVTSDDYQSEFALALEDYKAAVAVPGVASGGGGRKQGRMHMKLALFCDSELCRAETIPGGGGAAGSVKVSF